MKPFDLWLFLECENGLFAVRFLKVKSVRIILLVFKTLNRGTLIKKFVYCPSSNFRLFKLAGKVFIFTARDLDRKIAIIRSHMAAENGDKYNTVQSMLAYEIRCKMTHKKGRLPSGTRTLLRLQQALEFTIGFLQELADSDDQTRVRPLACAVYRRTLHKYQSKPVRKIAAAMMYLLPKRRRLVEVMCKHDPDEAIALMGQVVQVAAPAYERIYELYRSNDLLDIP